MDTLIQAIPMVAAAAALMVAIYERRENTRLRDQNSELLQLTADAAAQATLDSEASAELLSHLQAMRAENAALKGRQ